MQTTGQQAGAALNNPATIAALSAIPVAGPALAVAAPLLGQYFGAKGEQDVRDMQSEALMNYLNSVEAKREGAKRDIKGYQAAGEQQFMQEANTPLAELTQAKQDIAENASEAQQANARQIQAQLAQQGVRGGQAATLAGRQQGQLNREMGRDINQLAVGEGLGRQQARLGYTAQKGLVPYEALNKSQWLYMPSAQEQELYMNAINKKFA